MNLSTFLLSLIALAALCAMPATAGVVAETYSRTGADGAEVLESRMTTDGNRMRVETFDRGKADDYSIITGERLIIVDLRDRTYTVIDPVVMQARMAAVRQQMAATLKDLSPEQRAQFEAMMGGKAPGTPDTDPPVNVRDTGRKDTVNGRSCRIVEVAGRGGVQEHCVVATTSIAGGAEMMASIIEVTKAMETVFSGIGPMRGSMDRAVNEYKAINGIPVRTRQLKNGKVESEIFLKEIRQVTVPTGTFAPPAGFKEKPMDPL